MIYDSYILRSCLTVLYHSIIIVTLLFVQLFCGYPFPFGAALVLFYSLFIIKAMGQDTLDGVKRILKG